MRKKKELMLAKCEAFYKELAEALSDFYVDCPSPYNRYSACLCKKGDESKITFHGKPELSFRYANNWSWYTNYSNCNDPWEIQCYSPCLPMTRCRKSPGRGSDPIYAASVMIHLNGQYYPVYGETYNRETDKWSWIESSVYSVISKYNLLAEV